MNNIGNKILIVFDTAFGSTNIGDEIIMEAMNNELNNLIKKPFIFNQRIATHTSIPKEQMHFLKYAKIALMGGTNLFRLNYRPIDYKQNPLKINFLNSLLLHNVVFFGVGTTTTRSIPRKITSKLKENFYHKYSIYQWKKILSKDTYHSVRDNETLNMLRGIGIENVINTGCPSIWKLDLDHCEHIPQKKSKDVVVTISNSKSKNIALHYLRIVTKVYNNVYLWPQSIEDYPYITHMLKELGNKIKIIPSTLKAYDHLLTNNNSIDYVGTRLHGGIRAIQHKKRSIIIAVDSRALSFKRDFNLPVIDKNEIKNLSEIINSNIKININIKNDKINMFKKNLQKYIYNLFNL